jgi:hypothetical protein
MDPSKGEYLCPLCKSLCNIMVPFHATQFAPAPAPEASLSRASSEGSPGGGGSAGGSSGREGVSAAGPPPSHLREYGVAPKRATPEPTSPTG